MATSAGVSSAALTFKVPAAFNRSSSTSSSMRFNSSFTGERLILHSPRSKQCSSWQYPSLPTIVCKHKVHTKLKTNKSVVKRFRVTGRGIIMRRKAGKQHLLVKKRSNRKHRLRKMVPVKRCDYRAIIRACPYMKVKRKNTLASAIIRRLPETSPAVCLKRKILLYKARMAAKNNPPPAESAVDATAES